MTPPDVPRGDCRYVPPVRSRARRNRRDHGSTGRRPSERTGRRRRDGTGRCGAGFVPGRGDDRAGARTLAGPPRRYADDSLPRLAGSGERRPRFETRPVVSRPRHLGGVVRRHLRVRDYCSRETGAITPFSSRRNPLTGRVTGNSASSVAWRSISSSWGCSDSRRPGCPSAASWERSSSRSSWSTCASSPGRRTGTGGTSGRTVTGVRGRLSGRRSPSFRW